MSIFVNFPSWDDKGCFFFLFFFFVLFFTPLTRSGFWTWQYSSLWPLLIHAECRCNAPCNLLLNFDRWGQLVTFSTEKTFCRSLFWWSQPLQGVKIISAPALRYLHSGAEWSRTVLRSSNPDTSYKIKISCLQQQPDRRQCWVKIFQISR